jgi:AcrR family transcriptional regulator
LIRVIKNPHERRNELINIAEELFSKNGYDQTAVSEIVKKANVAQGLFYYYFKSKDEVLNAIIVRFIEEAKNLMETIVKNNEMNAVQKIFSTYENLGKFRQKREGLVNYIHEEKNEILHFRLENKVSPIITQGLRKIIKQGINEGIFHTKYPKEAAISILATEFAIFHEVNKGKHTQKRMEKHMLAIINLMERILGAKEGIFNDFKNFNEIQEVKNGIKVVKKC